MRISKYVDTYGAFFFDGTSHSKAFSVFALYSFSFAAAFAYLCCLTKILISEGDGRMKVVVVKSPKIFKGILRLLFGIKKQDAAE